jgi:predicted ABC-type ATPase
MIEDEASRELRPLVTSGPNGSGKSSILRGIESDGRAELLEADAIAKRMSPLDLRLAAIPAAREAILQTEEHLRAGRSFPIETTLSGGGTLKTMSQAKVQGTR